MTPRLLAALLLGCAGASVAQAPPATVIDPDQTASSTLGTQVATNGNVTTIDGGRVAGTNLFHSFAQFDLAAGDAARWTFSAGDPGAISNVVNRVTGGAPSRLFGTLDSSALPSADFYFLNPAGVIFGPEAQLNVPAAAHFSTAGTLHFSDGSAFAVTTPAGSTLSVAAPEAFGFLGSEGVILVDGTNAALLPDDSTLSLDASEIHIRDATLTGGGFRLHAAGTDAGIARLEGGSVGTGAVILENSFLITTAAARADGSISVAGGAVSLESSALSAYSSPAAQGGAIGLLADTLALNGASNIMTTGNDGTSAGDITITARSIELLGGSVVASRSSEVGAPGTISLAGEEIRLANGGIVSEAFGSGDAGIVQLAATRAIRFDDFSWISTDSNGSGDSGAVLVQTPRLDLTDSYISADALGDGDAGGAAVEAGDATLVRSYITSDSYNTGVGGLVELTVPGTLALHDASYVTSNAYASGDSGGVLIGGGALLLDRSSILASASGDGEALVVAIELRDRLRLENGARIASNTLGRGAAGGILIEAPQVELVASAIGSEALGEGDGGLVSIEASRSVSLDDGATLSSDTYGSGEAGGVSLTAGDLRIAGQSRISSDALGSGDGGSLDIAVGNELTLNDGGISADVSGTGKGGGVTVTARTIDMSLGFISADGAQTATGNGGDVSVKADRLSMETLSAITSDARGEGDGGNVAVSVGRLAMAGRSSISSLTLGVGHAGSVSLQGGTASLTDASINSDAFGSGDAGAVTVDVAALDMFRSGISSEAIEGGDSGTVDVKVAGTLTLRNAGIGTNTLGAGAAGDVTIEAGAIRMSDGSAISSKALELATGAGGNIDIKTGDFAILERSIVTTSLSNPNPAGNVVIEATNLLVSGAGSEISSENESDFEGPAGSVLVSGRNITLAEGGRISTNSANGSAGNILLDMPSDGFLILRGVTAPGVLETSSGPGTGGLIVIASPFAVVSHGGDILALGQSGGANVLISSKYFIASADRLNRVEVDGDLQFDNAIYDVSAGTVSPDLSLIDASAILRGQCPAVRASGALSQLSIRPTGPYAAGTPSGTVPTPGQAPCR
ncbi:two-partner secretion domain-containing protein [Allosphingosinicella deserti]|uniref:two-partner secretion domain-containing protein n=1 Tax=Allosphingosinicella deserti TaxID=2116704 RepID=UPI001304B6C7|nr:filamentous hemagglutinin N-terminal domain-containing protein [Sphingomonas deserti]